MMDVLLPPDEEDFVMMDNFSQRRNGKLQRSQDSGALTDWSNPRDSPTHSGEEDGEPPPPPPPPKFVTVLAVNGGLSEPPPPPAPAMTMEAPDYVGGGVVCLSSSGFVEEVACVARRPGEKLGFGLKFDGGTETDRPVQRLFIQCCAESSPAAQVRCSWGRLVEADQIVQIDGDDIRTLTRLQVVRKLTEGPDVLSVKIRHYWDDGERAEIVQQLNGTAGTSTPSRKCSAPTRQERAVDVPEELLQRWPAAIDPSPPVAPPRRRRRTKMSFGGLLSSSKASVARSLSSDEVLVNGQRVPAHPTISKPPRARTSRSFNAKESLAAGGPAAFPATLPRSCLKDPPSHRSILSVNCEPEPAQVYVDLIAEEDKRLSGLLSAESSAESDTCSSVSTVFGISTETASVAPPPPPATPQEHHQDELLLPVLIQPPATFLDDDLNEDVSPESTSNNKMGKEQQDASSDSGASSGESDELLQLVDSDCEELKVFQQVENAILQSKEEEEEVMKKPVPPPAAAISPPKSALATQAKPPAATTPSGIKPPAVRIPQTTSTSTTVRPSPSLDNKAARPSLNRTPIRSRIPQAVTPPTTKSRPGATSTTGVAAPRPAVRNVKSGLIPAPPSGPVQSRIPRPAATKSSPGNSSSLPRAPPRPKMMTASNKSTSRLHLTAKGESSSSDLAMVSAH